MKIASLKNEHRGGMMKNSKEIINTDQVNNRDKYSHVKYVIIIMLISLYGFVVTMALIIQYI